MKGSGVSGPAIGASRRQNPKRVPSGGYRDSGHRASDIGCQHHLSVPRYNRTAVIGQTISHYRITEKLGEGGMGVVYKAEDEKLRRLVALKFLPSNLLADDEVKARFIREAQAAASLNHPNICTVYAIDEFEGHFFIAMEYVEGETVRDKTKRGPLKLQEAVDLAVQTAHGLEAAHQKGIVHRDVKGSNVMVTPQGQVKLMDFGLAQLGDRTQLTKTGDQLGTAAYMSPEQTLGERVDRRTDIWSLV